MSKDKEFKHELKKIRDSIQSFCEEFKVTEFDVYIDSSIDMQMNGDQKVFHGKATISATRLVDKKGYHHTIEV